MSSDLEDTLNMIEDGEDPNDFGGLESGEEIDEDDIVDEDYGQDSGAEVGGEHGDEIENEPGFDDINSVESIAERHFTEMFLASLGGSDKVLTGNVVGDDLNKLREHSVSGWSEPESPDVHEYLQRPYKAVGEENSYPDLRKEPFGPTPDAMKCGNSPLALFFYFMPVALWQHIAVCSNNYKHEQTEARVEAYFERRKNMLRR
eukprot:jgi/Phyca11/121333/e_gw1.43.320.1